MELGQFSVSLSVKDLRKSMTFYKALGFTQCFGEPAQNWVILKNGEAHIGLFQGMFEENLLTFNPTDARAIQAVIKEAGYEIEKEAEDGEGPAHFAMRDPDGNSILVDQHV
ncbi:MAG: VOC family protein [Planctomycetota bacterium]|jgi:catechol 2,3-dioxygenase-like lactoylglutathione lyase family enzyme